MRFLINNEEVTLKYLYHATYKPFLNSIKKNGLGNTNRKMYSDSKGKGAVYLADDVEIAISYAEESEWVEEQEDPDRYLDNIIILKIDVSKLDQDKLFSDENVRNIEDDVTYEYHGIIPFDAVIDVIEDK